ncbi:hypothetical protein [Streptomyces melanogenes]|uniref:hypothetical protein n=1 Tax=Streptomyces melanogenes TaxID=67326 RepID=UPI00379819F3
MNGFIMPDDSSCRHIDPAACPDVSESQATADTFRPAFTLVRDTSDHDVTATASRQLRRADDFRAAAQFMIGSGFHPKAGRTTLRLAEVFAVRMKRSKDGHFPFSINMTAHELGLCRRAVLNHARYLRELGLIAYVEHGSRANVLRTRQSQAWQPGDGYAGTATIFAAVAPPVWDRALGRRMKGSGYRARLFGVTDHGRALAVDKARQSVAKKAPARRSSCTPSVVVPQDHSQLQVEGGSNYTPRQRAERRTTSPSTSTDPHRVTPAACAHGVATAQRVRQEVWWLHRACPRRLGYALRPLIFAGWTWQSLAAELLTWGVPGYLRDPAAYVRHELGRRQRTGDLHVPHQTDPVAVDDDGGTRRHAEMLRSRLELSGPAWQRYATELRPQLRRRLTHTRPGNQAPQPARLGSGQLRESEADFTSSLPIEARRPNIRAQDIYQARAYGRPEPAFEPTPHADHGWLVHLNDQLAAERACAALRIELSDWEQSRQSDHRQNLQSWHIGGI